MTFQIRTRDGEILTVRTTTGDGLSKVIVERERANEPFDAGSIEELLAKVEQD